RLLHGDDLVDGRLERIIQGPDERLTPVLECEGGETDCVPPAYGVTAEMVLSNATATSVHSPGAPRQLGEVRLRLVIGNGNVDRDRSVAFVAKLAESVPKGLRYVSIVRNRDGVAWEIGNGSSAIVTDDGALHGLVWADEFEGLGISEAKSVDALRQLLPQ
ncbi:MAG: hypothetical protein ABW033_03865, partial [Acidimicrobiia bacterium]